MKRYTTTLFTLFLSLFAALWLLSPPPASAANIVVSTTADLVANDGLCSLREAVIAANTNAAFNGCIAGTGSDTIQFDPALPSPATFALKIAGTAEDGALTGDLDLSGTLTISGDGQNNTIIDGNTIDRVFHIQPSANVNITGVTIRDGDPGAANGGGIAVEQSARLTLNTSTIINNTAVLGGGAYNLGGLTLNDSTVQANRNGGLHNNGGLLTLANVQILKNSGGYGITNELQGSLQYRGGWVSENIGGGILNDFATAHPLTDLTIDLNTVGGGLHNKGVAINNATLNITNSSIQNNTATSGAGLFNEGVAASATVENSQISGNIATAAGGGISNVGTLVLKTSTIDNNQARIGGGIDHQGISFNAENVTVSGNLATDNGGGIANHLNAILTNVTINGNSASTGANILNNEGAQLSFANTIIANPVSGANCFNDGGLLNSLGYNLESTNVCSLTGTGDIINTDPLLGSLQNNGGPTPTHALLTDSPAIDKGNNASCPSTDQRGVNRPVGPSCDIGSYEANGVNPVYAVDLSPDAAKSGIAGQTVAYTLILSNNGNVADTFDLSISDNNWSTTLSETEVALPASQATNIIAYVTIPGGALGNNTDSVSVTAVSQGDLSTSDSASLTTTVMTVYGVSLSPNQEKSAEPGQSVTYTLTVTNTGNLTDNFELAVSGNNWSSNLSDTSVTLEPGLNATVFVVVHVPANAAINVTDVANITATSQGDSSKNATAQLATSSIKLLYSYLPVVVRYGG